MPTRTTHRTADHHTPVRPSHVWYASYGSNMYRSRFLTYLQGGRPAGAARSYPGCTDPTPPRDDTPIRWAGRLHFATRSPTWGGGVALADEADRPGQEILGRAYLITAEQFDQVVHFENSGTVAAEAAPTPLLDVVRRGRARCGTGLYNMLSHLGDREGVPVVTFTSEFTHATALRGDEYVVRGGRRYLVHTERPSPAYARMIGGGLAETFGLDVPGQADYIRRCPGGDQWDREALIAALHRT